MFDTKACKNLAFAVLKCCANDMIQEASLPEKKREAERAIKSGECDFWFAFLDTCITPEIFLKKIHEKIERS